MQRRIWAIADTHLSFASPKPMDIFGQHWHNHAARIQQQCKRLVEPNDLLLIPGDISWALKRKDAEPDLSFIADLPGIKVLCKGNHDYWWDSDRPLSYQGLNDTPFTLPAKEIGVAGTRGWIPINDLMTDEQKISNERIISREKRRLSKRLDAITDCAVKIVIIHYPPLDDFRALLEDHNVSVILYGHLHLGSSEFPTPEKWYGIPAHCVASDRISFTPKLIMSI